MQQSLVSAPFLYLGKHCHLVEDMTKHNSKCLQTCHLFKWPFTAVFRCHFFFVKFQENIGQVRANKTQGGRELVVYFWLFVKRAKINQRPCFQVLLRGGVQLGGASVCKEQLPCRGHLVLVLNTGPPYSQNNTEGTNSLYNCSWFASLNRHYQK